MLAPFISIIHKDVAGLSDWFNVTEKHYQKLKLPKIPLLLTVLITEQATKCAGFLKEDGWKEVGWYPSCHFPLSTGYQVILYKKEQDVPLYEERIGQRSWDNLEWIPPVHFNQSGIFSCSCAAYNAMPKLTIKCDRHRTMGVHRRTEPTQLLKFNNWRRFAITPLASYWFWGLLPKETNRHKYEK